MAEVRMIDVEDHTTPKDLPLVNGPDRPNKSTKRKRPQTPSVRAVTAMSTEERESRIDGLNNELDELLKYYKEILSEKTEIGVLSSIEKKEKIECVIACLIEESELPLSKLVEEVYEKLKGTEGVCVTMASVKNSVLFVGQRLAYGVSNADADVLEDDSGPCLWCWEARDLKLVPKVVRGILQIRRTCRKKINERISAITAMVSALKNLENCQNYKRDIMKASEKLFKVLSEADIRVLMDSMTQKNGTDKADKEAKREEKLLIKQLEKSKREAEKEKKTMEHESEKEKCQNEKELKRLNEESEKRREKEETEMRKQLRRQQEEAEKDQKRRDKEEAELKRQRAIQKQASILERFLKKSQDTSPGQNENSSAKVAVAGPFSMSNEKLPEAVTLSMDSALSQNDEINTEDIRKLHYTSWHNLGQNIRSNRKQHWGIRRKPKTAMIKELKLTNTRELVCDDNLNVDKPVHACEGTNRDDRPFQTNADSSSPSTHLSYRSKQLLQFDKSHRPAFYGICRKRSNVVRPQNPFRKDPDLDYDIDSDEEWEEMSRTKQTARKSKRGKAPTGNGAFNRNKAIVLPTVKGHHGHGTIVLAAKYDNGKRLLVASDSRTTYRSGRVNNRRKVFLIGGNRFVIGIAGDALLGIIVKESLEENDVSKMSTRQAADLAREVCAFFVLKYTRSRKKKLLKAAKDLELTICGFSKERKPQIWHIHMFAGIFVAVKKHHLQLGNWVPFDGSSVYNDSIVDAWSLMRRTIIKAMKVTFVCGGRIDRFLLGPNGWLKERNFVSKDETNGIVQMRHRRKRLCMLMMSLQKCFRVIGIWWGHR